MNITSCASSKSGNTPSVLISHPTGNQNVRNALLSLVEHDMLAEFWTAIAWNPNLWLNRMLTSGLQTQLARRVFDEAPKDRVRCDPFREVVRLGARSSLLNVALCAGERPFSIIGVYRHFDARVARRLGKIKIDTVYAYEGGALETFREARRLGIRTMYELTTGHWYWKRKVLTEETKRNPGFAELLPHLHDSARHLAEKDEELELADVVVVPSQHVRKTLEGIVSDERIKVTNYGAPAVRMRDQVSRDANKPLKVLFAGSLAQHKGIGYVLDAINMLGSKVELTLVGRRHGTHPRVNEACRRWKWFETIPHDKVLDLMMQSDVLVLPSFSEGFGLVVTEALSCGLPVIVTPNVGASDLVRHGQEGFVVPLFSAEAIAERLNELHADRNLLARMSQNARAAAARRPWDVYREIWAETVKAASCY